MNQNIKKNKKTEKVKINDNDHKFYTGRSDTVFKEIFLREENKDILIALLEFTLDLKVKNIIYENVEMLTGNVNVRRNRLDMLLTTDKGIIGIEMNAQYKDYVRIRNYSYYCGAYSGNALRGENYNEDVNIIQLNFSYGLSKIPKYRHLRIMEKYWPHNDRGDNFVDNTCIIEYNMDKIQEFWHNKNEEEIEKYKYLLMLDLGLEELKTLAKKDRLVEKYMEKLDILNKDPAFRIYMSKEEDEKRIYNTEIMSAKKEGKLEVAQNLLISGADVEYIVKNVGLTVEEVTKLAENPEIKKAMPIDDKKRIYNSEIISAKKEGKLEIARNLLNLGIATIEQISEVTGLSLEEVKQLQYDLKN